MHAKAAALGRTLGAALVGALLVVHGCELATPAWRLSAHGERRWWTWASRRGDVAEIFARAEVALRAGESVVLVVPARSPDPAWWGTMATYYLVRHPVRVVRAGADPACPPGTALVWVRWTGAVEVRRPSEESGDDGR